ncbi:hypothetical protein N7448_008004 [Penicillium atrosanguineum]|nr:hypothetical protein N7448_008004 [Penicillium atrosanguineum]
MTRKSGHMPPLDSPSKQLMIDLIRDLEQAKLFSTELKKVHAFERKAYYESLDQIDREQEAVHTAALDKVAALHNQVREEAESVLKEHIRAEEEEHRRREERERKERERIQREQAEKQRREQEEAARLEAERKAKEKAKEEAKKKAEEEAEHAQRAVQEEKDRKDRQEKERVESEKRKQEEDAKKAQQTQQAADQAAEQQARSQQQQKIGASRLTPEELAAQERYVAIHKALKEMRQYLRNAGKQNPLVKKTMGDMRRSIKKCVGQLRDGKGANKKQLQDIKVELLKASAVPEPTVDIRQFLANTPPEIAAEENKVPAMLIYGLNIFAKCLISALITEASINHAHAEPIGIVAAQIFSMDEFMYKGIHMSDILWAKYRVVCPALWGFSGSEKTEAGRMALGWWREETGGPFISEQTHLDPKRVNPFPNTLFWTSIQKILSIPPGELQDTQVTLLQSMLKSSEERILTFFGQFGLVIMRKAIVELPAAIPRKSMPVTQLKLLQETYMRHSNILV